MDVLCVEETGWKESRFKLFYHGVGEERNGGVLATTTASVEVLVLG